MEHLRATVSRMTRISHLSRAKVENNLLAQPWGFLFVLSSLLSFECACCLPSCSTLLCAACSFAAAVPISIQLRTRYGRCYTTQICYTRLSLFAVVQRLHSSGVLLCRPFTAMLSRQIFLSAIGGLVSALVKHPLSQSCLKCLKWFLY